MRITESVINNVTIKPLIHSQDSNPDDVKGGKLLSQPYNITFLCAKRKSGKTTILAKCALETTTKKTIFWIFSPTAHVDDTMIELIKRLKKRGNIVNVFPSLMDGKEDILDTIIDKLLEDDDPKDKIATSAPKPKAPKIGLDNREVAIRIGGKVAPDLSKTSDIPVDKFERKKSEYVPKKKFPEYCFIIDDLATELNKTRGGLATLCFNGRHLKASVYISFQYKNQLPPCLWCQSTYLFLFKNLSREKLEEIFKALDLHNLNLKQFFEVYDYSTTVTEKEKYPFLLCSVTDGKYRRNFNKEISMAEEEIQDDFDPPIYKKNEFTKSNPDKLTKEEKDG